MPQVARLIHILYLGIGQCSNTVGAPVDDTAALVDQALFIQGNEHFTDGLGAGLVHGKGSTVPGTGGAQRLLLLHDAVAVLVLPVPDTLQELFTAQVVTGQDCSTREMFRTS